MLTVRQCLSTGYEFLFEAKRINYQPATPPDVIPKGDRPDLQTLFVETPTGDVHTLISGVYYIMNDAGKTVAKYDLGPEPLHG